MLLQQYNVVATILGFDHSSKISSSLCNKNLNNDNDRTLLLYQVSQLMDTAGSIQVESSASRDLTSKALPKIMTN